MWKRRGEGGKLRGEALVCVGKERGCRGGGVEARSHWAVGGGRGGGGGGNRGEGAQEWVFEFEALCHNSLNPFPRGRSNLTQSIVRELPAFPLSFPRRLATRRTPVRPRSQNP